VEARNSPRRQETERDSAPLRVGFEAALKTRLENDPELREQLVAILGASRNIQSMEATSGGVIDNGEQRSSGSDNRQTLRSDGGQIRNARQIT
jgi:hypothetical protein